MLPWSLKKLRTLIANQGRGRTRFQMGRMLPIVLLWPVSTDVLFCMLHGLLKGKVDMIFAKDGGNVQSDHLFSDLIADDNKWKNIIFLQL